MPQELALKNIRLFAERVMPAFERRRAPRAVASLSLAVFLGFLQR